MQDQEWCIDLVGEEERRVGDVLVTRGPKVVTDSALRLLVLKHSTSTTAPSNATVGAGHVADRGARFGTGKHVGLGDQVRRLVTAPTVPLHSDVIFVHKALGNQVANTWQDRIGRTRTRLSCLVRNVRNEDEISPAHIEAVANDGATGRRRIVTMEVVGVSLIEIDQQRILLVRIEVVGSKQDPVERLAVVGFPVHQFSRSPGVVFLLWIDVAHTFNLFKLSRAGPQIGAHAECASCEQDRITILRFLQTTEVLVQHDESLRPRRFCLLVFLFLFGCDRQRIKAARFGLSVKCTEHDRFRRFNRSLLTIQAKVAKSDLLFSALSLRDANRFRLAGRVNLPDVESIVDQ